MGKVQIGGIKLSSKVLQLTLSGQDNSLALTTLLFSILNKNKINLPFASTIFMHGNFQASCCVSYEDKNRVIDIINSVESLKKQIRFINGLGMLSVFPHQSSLKLLGIALYALGNAHIPLFGMLSSISSLTFITDYTLLEKAVASLLNYLDIPANHAPFRPNLISDT